MTEITALRRVLVLAVCLLFLSLNLFAQNDFKVVGKINDDTGKPVEGATVTVKGTSISTATKADGSFELMAPSGKSTLIISHVAFATREVALNDRGEVNLSLQPQTSSLTDVVVVGYGTQKKSDVTGALTSISAKTIQERPVQNLLQAVQGKAAGVNVATNIKPGELPIVRIRGTRSLNASNDPLYVVDGIPIVSALGVTSFSVNDLNPNDIQSMEILKDASATAIYGSRGANGVVLITTKKGQRGRMGVNFNTTVSLDSYNSLTDWINGGEYIDRLRNALINGRRYQPGNPTDLSLPRIQWFPDPKLDSANFNASGVTNNYGDLIAAAMKGYERNSDGSVKMRPTTAAEQAMGWPAMVPVYNSANVPTYDWMNATTRQGITQQYQLSVSAGTEAARLYLSLGYFNQAGVQKDQDYQRFNFQVNGDVQANKWFALGISMITSLAEQDFGINANQGNTGSKDLYGRSLDQFPWALPTNAAGAYIRNPGGNLNIWNPLIDIDQSKNNRRTLSALGNIYSEIKFTPWLKYRINFGAQIRNFRNGSWTGPDVTAHLTARANTASYARDENLSWVVENLLYFDKVIKEKHAIGVTLLQSSQKSRREGTSTSVSGVVIPLSLWYDLGSNTAGNPGISTGFTENTLTSFMGRINYTFNNKYLVTATGRYDGASVLAPDHKWDFFPSFAVAWKMQEEAFINKVAWITELKPRIGYGVTGNSSVNPYTTSGPLSRNNYVFGSTPAIGFLPQLVQNPDLGWEKTAQWNYGIDFGFFNGRIAGSLEYYDQKTDDLIFQRALPAVSGYVTKFMNIGKTRNNGIEITLSTINIQKSDFTWITDLNWSKNNEEIVSLVNGPVDMVAQRLFIGKPIQVFYQLNNAGIWGNSAKELDDMAKFKSIGGLDFKPGTIRVVDQNGDYKIDAADYVIRGTPRPKWYGGITNTFKYKNFALSCFIYARVGQTYFGGYPGIFGRDERDVWTWENKAGRYPQHVLGATGFTNIASSMQYIEGTFVTVRNISLTYNLPQSLLRRANIKTLELNVQVLNPFIFGGDAVKMGINPDDETNWAAESQPGTFNTNPLGGVNNNTILPQSIVFGLRLAL